MKFYFKRTYKKVSYPIIPLQLSFRKKSFKTTALIDSGSPYTIFDYDIANYLGIKITSGKKGEITGVTGGRMDVYFHRMTLHIRDYSYEADVGFMHNHRFAFNLLGHRGFFEKFKVYLGLRDGVIDIHPYKDVN